MSRARRIDRRLPRRRKSLELVSGFELSTYPFEFAFFRNITRCYLCVVVSVQMLIKSLISFYNLRVIIFAIRACTFTQAGDSVVRSR